MQADTSRFNLYPAIDLIDGKAVRLLQGRFDDLLTSDHDDAIERAQAIWSAGATCLHVIDLDAARTGTPAEPNASLIADLVAQKPPGTLIQVGGGLRSVGAVETSLAAGADRVLLGTLAFSDPASLERLLSAYGRRIAVAIDSRNNTVRTHGWLEDAGVPVAEAAQRLATQGVGTFLVTGIERDGSLAGPDLSLLGAIVSAVEGTAMVIAAGGITTPADVRAVRALGCVGAVVGRALLDDPMRLAALLQASR